MIAAGVLQRAYQSIADSANRDELVDKLRSATAEAGGDEAVVRMQDSFDAIADGKASSAPVWATLAARRPLVLPLGGRDESVAAMVRGALGLVHADFAAAFAHWDARRDDLRDEDRLAPALEKLVAEFSRDLRHHQAAVYAALAVQAPTDRIAQNQIAALVDFVVSRTRYFARVQAAAYWAVDALHEDGRGGAAERIGLIAATAGGLTRQAIASLAAGLKLSLDLASTDSYEGIEVAEAARTQAFEMTLPNGRNVSLHRLDEVPDSDFVEVSARVAGLSASRDGDGKLIGRLELIDPSSGARAAAAAIFVDWRHVGLTRGSYCSFSAEFRSSLAALGGVAGLLIDRLPQNQLEKQSWRFRFLRSAKRWFEPYRNGHNMIWSLGPHDTEAVSLADSEVAGASELVFLELLDRG
ncbi:hypothetical protein B8W66_13235 [Mycobacterium decipiens]|uniref:Uncharacterized protein n=1 Tax=Mycobacterium decipiens TaxID=1430326 RepID=A0A1X2LTQ5_9MYCO|nr:hypothetical protein B8W66_13235 [Mycobacterium decipiens]